MVKPAAPAKLISAKPVEKSRQAKRPEIARLAEFDPMIPTANKSIGRSTGKDGRSTVTELIKEREADVTLHRELAEERKRFEDFRGDETVRTMRIVADKD